MFTGIIQGVGLISSIGDRAGVRTFEIDLPDGFAEGLTVGASVSVDGVCLTVTKILSQQRVSFDVIQQSIAVSTLGDIVLNEIVNVERAAKDGAEIGGHPLSGHVDFSTEIDRVVEEGGNKVLRVHIPKPFCRYVFSKGYIAVNGASLTVAECDKANGWFEVWLIPETRRTTNLDYKRVGDLLNVEIERGTQVIVDTVRESITDGLVGLKPVLEAILASRGLVIEDLIEPQLLLSRTRSEEKRN